MATQLRPILAIMVRRIVVGPDNVKIELSSSSIVALLRDGSPSRVSATGSTEPKDQPSILLSVPARLRRVGTGIRIVINGAAGSRQRGKADPKLIKLIARAHLFNDKLAKSSSEYLTEVAQQEGLTRSYFTRVLRLSYLAPDVTRAILEGRHPRGLTAEKLLARSRLPLAWSEQRRILGFA